MLPLNIGFGVSLGLAPTQGPRVLPFACPITVLNVPQIIDLFAEEVTGQLDFIQGVYLNNGANAFAVSLTAPTTQQTVTWGPNTQGFLPLFLIDKGRVSLVAGGAAIYVPIFCNFPVAASIWKVT